MVERVLVPVDDSDLAERALVFAIETYRDAVIEAMHVVPVSATFVEQLVGLSREEEFDRAVEQQAEPILERAQKLGADRGTEVETSMEMGNPSREILERATDTDADLIVIGGHGRTAPSRILLGSVTETVVRRSPVPVTIVR